MRSRAWSRVLPRASGLGTAYSGQSAAARVRTPFLVKFRPILPMAMSAHPTPTARGRRCGAGGRRGCRVRGTCRRGAPKRDQHASLHSKLAEVSVRRRRRLPARPRCFVVLIWCIAHHSPRPSWQDLRTANGCNSALRASLWHPRTSSRQLGAALRAGRRLKNLCREPSIYQVGQYIFIIQCWLLVVSVVWFRCGVRGHESKLPP